MKKFYHNIWGCHSQFLAGKAPKVAATSLACHRHCLLCKTKGEQNTKRRKLDPSVVTGSKKPVTKSNHRLIYIIQYGILIPCIRQWFDFVTDFFGREVDLFAEKLHCQHSLFVTAISTNSWWTYFLYCTSQSLFSFVQNPGKAQALGALPVVAALIFFRHTIIQLLPARNSNGLNFRLRSIEQICIYLQR